MSPRDEMIRSSGRRAHHPGWYVLETGGLSWAPHIGHVSNFRSLNGILLEPDQVVDWMPDSAYVDGCIQTGHPGRMCFELRPFQFPDGRR
jgi:hypothetical protein